MISFYLNNIFASIFSLESLNSYNIKSTKKLTTLINP